MREDARNARGVAQETGCGVSNGRESPRHRSKESPYEHSSPKYSVHLYGCGERVRSTRAAEYCVTKLGPQVGERVADFRLQDQDGKVWTRDTLMGPNGLMLVFLRSADW